jgi:phosphatidylglycerophosphatase A
MKQRSSISHLVWDCIHIATAAEVAKAMMKMLFCSSGILLFVFLFFLLEFSFFNLLLMSFILLLLIGGLQFLRKYLEDLAKSDPNWHLIEGLKNLDERSNM